VQLKKNARKIILTLQFTLRRIVNTSLFDIFVLRNKYSLSHLRIFDEYPAGPIQRDEALLLYALVKTVDPKTMVEFGFLAGHSALNFLKAMSQDARLYSYDISDMSKVLSSNFRDPRFKFFFKSQTDFEPSDVDNRPVDLVLFDASHDLSLNIATFHKIKDCLNEKALIMVHDTGIWHINPKGFQSPEGYFLGGLPDLGYIHRPGERRFVNYIRENLPDFDQIHLHSTSKFRHGLTVLQRNAGPLPL
jgi:hypothetical protein